MPSFSKLHDTSSLLLWNTLFSLLAVSITFFIPTLSYASIDITAMAQNIIGSFIIGWVACMSSIKYQYFQTYVLYDGLASGFCAVFTSFGQFIIQLDILFWTQHGILKALFHFFGTVVFSFVGYWLGRKVARRTKRGVRFVKYMNKLEHDHERMQFEVMYSVENREKEAYAAAAPVLRNRGQQHVSPSQHGSLSATRRRSIQNQVVSHQNQFLHAIPASSSTSPHAFSVNTHEPESTESSPLISLRAQPLHASDDTTAPITELLLSPFSEQQTEKFYKTVTELEDHLHVQLDKKRRHTSKDLQPRDYAIISIMCFVIIFVTSMVILAQVFQFDFLSEIVDSGAKELIWFEYVMALFWSVLGAFSGRIIGGIGLVKRKKTVQWRTFRVNLLSCILIGSAHNILLFRHYFPYGDHAMFDIVFRRFIIDFCGSESSFCGLIDETSKLWRTKSISKLIAIRNFMYNLVFCVFVFLLVVYSVRIAFFYDLRLLWRR